MKQYSVAIIGASGFVGSELIKILKSHPAIKKITLGGRNSNGLMVSDIYENLSSICDLEIEKIENACKSADVIFLAMPHGMSEEIVLNYCDNKLIIDLGADFRLDSEADYIKWYDTKFKNKKLHKKSIYIIPEVNGDKFNGERIIANPGCYPTASILSLFPILNSLSNDIDLNSIVIDAKSGITGAGKASNNKTHFISVNENFKAYAVTSHRHTPEINQELSKIAKKEINVLFTPHLLPVNRGIFATCYISLLNKDITVEEIINLYKQTYKDKKFIRIKKSEVSIKDVKGSNYCDIAIYLDKTTNKIIVTTVIDNMYKGASGQAVQNMNIALNLDETMGLSCIPSAF